MSLLRKGRLMVFLAVAAVVAAGLALSVDGIRWRATVVTLRATGEIQDIGWFELLSMMKPGSDIYVEPLRRRPNPYAVIRNPHRSATDVETGERLFLARCASCHGATGHGESAPSLVGRALRMGDSDWSLFRSINDGLPESGMPPVPMPDVEAWQIVAYLRDVRRSDGSSGAARPPPETPSRAGPVDVPAQRIRNAASEPENWLTYSGSYRSWRYTALEQIDADNVSDLKLAWSLQLDTQEFVEASPIVVDGVMYLSSPPSDVLAVDAATGEVLWRHNRSIPSDVPACCGRVNRGVTVLGERVYIGTLDGYLVALDAQTGQVAWESQVADYEDGFSLTAAPLAVEDAIVVGVAGGEYGIRGFLDAYDPDSGERLWRFHTVPEPGQFGADTWSGDSWRTGGGPTWVTGSYDPELGLLYWGVGNPAPDFNGDGRLGDNLFTNSVVALDIESGELEWHFQFTPHDEHDWDSNQIPVLVDREFEGRRRPLMLWANRNGFYYVLDRATGEFLHASAFVTQNWAERIDPEGRPVLTPSAEVSQRGTLTWPGVSGGANWWSPSYSPKTDLFYVPLAEAPSIFFKDMDADEDEPQPNRQFLGSISLRTGEPMQAGVRALDPATGEIVWEYLRPPRRDTAGMGGTLASAGGLVFTGDVNDFVAFDAENGRELWRTNLGGRINASPVSFAVDDRQMVSIPAGNTLYAFGL